MPELFDLYWNSGVDYGRISAIASGALGGTISFPRPVPATILYPSLFTPAMLFRPSEDDGAAYFELLLATPNGQELTAEQVNLGLVITRGLSWKRFARERPIFDALGDRIQVQAATRTGKLGVATSSLFRGNLHSLWDKYLPKGFQGKNAGIWSVRVSAEALANVATSLTVLPGQDPMDRAIQQLFNQRASPAFREAKTFRYTNDTVQSERPQGDKPILAHHPLVVYPPGQQALKKVVHLTDLHLNLRQDLLARSDARVIEHPDARDVSPPIGTMVHRYSRSVSQLLHAVPGDTDALCIGGDLVDHIRNATPRPLEKLPANAAAVWEAVALSKGTYSKLYQAGPDFIAAYTIFRDFLSQRHVPLIGVSGNHDAYLDGYGISPRVFDLEWRILGNEGIAADHNLTFYEALLAFGPTYHEYSGYGDARGKLMTVAHNSSNFHKDWFDWFHVMFSPFADFRIQLPIQRLVGLGWGMSEHMLGTTDDGQGAGHLPRADGAVAEEQLALLRDGVSASRPTLLVSHFTFASFSGRIGEEPVRSQEPQGFLNVLRSSPPRPGGAIVGRGSGLRPPPPIKMYTDFDEGTFTDDRGSVYGLLLSQPEAFVAVLTGHSHRKAVYVLRQESEGVLAAMKGMSKSAGVDHLRSITSSKAVISVLSDAAGPIPRANISNEFGKWGSDSPTGTVLQLGADGRLEKTTVLRASGVTKPRAVVALEYCHYQGLVDEGNAVWDGDAMQLLVRRASDPSQRRARFWLRLQARWESLGLSVAGVQFLGRLAAAPGAPVRTRWVRIPGAPSADDRAQWKSDVESAGLPRGSDRSSSVWEAQGELVDELREWLSIGTTSDRFLALRFSADDRRWPGHASTYDWLSWWTFEVRVTRTDRGDSPWEIWRIAPVTAASLKSIRAAETANAVGTAMAVGAGGWAAAPQPLPMPATSGPRPSPDQPDFVFRRNMLPNKYAVPARSSKRIVP